MLLILSFNFQYVRKHTQLYYSIGFFFFFSIQKQPESSRVQFDIAIYLCIIQFYLLAILYFHISIGTMWLEYVSRVVLCALKWYITLQYIIFNCQWDLLCLMKFSIYPFCQYIVTKFINFSVFWKWDGSVKGFWDALLTLETGEHQKLKSLNKNQHIFIEIHGSPNTERRKLLET